MAKVASDLCHACPGSLVCATDANKEILYCPTCNKLWLRPVEKKDADMQHPGFFNKVSDNFFYVTKDCPAVRYPAEGHYDFGDGTGTAMGIQCPSCFQKTSIELGGASNVPERSGRWWVEKEQPDDNNE